jgi:hypothetical protein
MTYIKYYNLEQYIFQEVGPKFRKTGAITTEDFFCIVIWKANRAKTNIKNKLSKGATLDKAVMNISNDIYKANTNKEKLEIMVKKWKFGLPMATAILTALYPEDFTVYDYRVRKQLGLDNIYSVDKYFSEFLPKVKEHSVSLGENLRNTDKELWGKSFYEDLQKLIKND